jgi:hypothetical protein
MLLLFCQHILYLAIRLTKTCKILHYCYRDNVCSLRAILLLYSLKKFWCQLPEDGEMIAAKHVGAVCKIVHMDYGIEPFLLLHELLTSCLRYLLYMRLGIAMELSVAAMKKVLILRRLLDI